jgi:hypothetical protein
MSIEMTSSRLEPWEKAATIVAAAIAAASLVNHRRVFV